VSATPAGAGTLVGLTAVIAAVTAEVPRVLVVGRTGTHGGSGIGVGEGGATADDAALHLPSGPFDPARDRTLESCLRGWVAEQTGLDLRYVEQLYTFGDRHRDPRELAGGPRLLSVAYLALTREEPPAGTGDARWRDWYGFLPWEDWREGRPPLIDEALRPALRHWIDAACDGGERRRREERVDICFGFGAAPWDPVRTLERYELLYEAGLVVEAARDRAERAQAAGAPALYRTLASAATADGTGAEALAPVPAGTGARTGAAMALDDRRMLATALGRLRGKLAWRPVVFDLLPPEFTLFALQRVVEALTGQRLHKQNFRRMLAGSALVEPTGRMEHAPRGRPAELYRFRREVLRAKATAGVALPAPRTSG
jgi:hypothetical protein